MFARIIGLVFVSAISLQAGANGACSAADLRSNEAIAFLKQTFEAAQYECAVAFTKSHGSRISSLPGLDGIDTRFALREAATALAANRRHPAEWRRALAKAAAWTANLPNPASAAKEEVHADVRMLLTAADNFLSDEFRRVGALAHEEETVKRGNLGNWIDVLLAAIALDRHLPDADRALSIHDVRSAALSETGRSRLYAPLVQLAAITRGDKVMQGIRYQLARDTYFHSSCWREKDPKELILERCEQVLKITDLLADQWNCGAKCMSMNWHWRPIMNVGVAYYRIDMKDDAARAIQRSLGVVRAIENPDYRLSQLNSAFTELLVIKYDRAVLGPLVKEMWQLANTLNTAWAKEVRQRLPETLKHWGLSDLLE